MSKQQLRLATARLKEARKRLESLQREEAREHAVREGTETRREREIVRKRIFALRKQITAARTEVKRAHGLVRYFADPTAGRA